MNKTKIILPILLYIGINISAAGRVQDTDSTDIFFRHLELGEVVITGLAGDTKVKKMPSPVTVMRPADLRSKASTNIIGTLAQQPGISELGTGPGISKPIIRGLGYNRVVVVNDGIRQEGQQWGDEHGIEIDGADIYSVEVLKGPASLMYGSDALSGVIIFHPEPLAALGTMTGSLSTEYQTNNKMFNYSVSNAGNIGGWVWNARFSDKYAHAYKNPYDGYVGGSGFKERAASGMVGKNGDWGFSRLKFSYYNIRPGIVEGERDARTGELEGSHSCKAGLPFQQIYHYKLVSDNSIRLGEGQLKAVVGWQQNRRKEFEESVKEPGLDMKLNTVNYDIKYISGPLRNWKLAAGVNGMYQNSRNLGEEVLIPNYHLFDLGGFATATFSAGEWSLSGGVRTDLRALDSKALDGHFLPFSKKFYGFSASIGAVRQFGEKFSVKANIARGFRAPNLSELGSNGKHEGTFRYETGNNNLKPENSLQGDLGLDFTSSLITLQAAVFTSHISNYIFLAATGGRSAAGDPVYTYLSSSANLRGGEVSVDFHPVHSLHLASAFSCVYAKSKSGDNMPMIPAPRLFSEVKYEFTHDGEFLNNTFLAVNLDWNMRQDRVYAKDGTETPTPGYALLGASVGTDVVIGGRTFASVYIIASNLTDKAYQSHLSRLKYAGSNPVTGRNGVFNPGRNFTVKALFPF